MKQIYCPPPDDVDDTPVYYADWNGSENVFSFSKIDNNPKTRPVIVYNKNLCKIKATSAKKKTDKKNCIFPQPQSWWSSISPFPSLFVTRKTRVALSLITV